MELRIICTSKVRFVIISIFHILNRMSRILKSGWPLVFSVGISLLLFSCGEDEIACLGGTVIYNHCDEYWIQLDKAHKIGDDQCYNGQGLENIAVVTSLTPLPDSTHIWFNYDYIPYNVDSCRYVPVDLLKFSNCSFDFSNYFGNSNSERLTVTNFSTNSCP